MGHADPGRHPCSLEGGVRDRNSVMPLWPARSGQRTCDRSGAWHRRRCSPGSFESGRWLREKQQTSCAEKTIYRRLSKKPTACTEAIRNDKESQVLLRGQISLASGGLATWFFAASPMRLSPTTALKAERSQKTQLKTPWMSDKRPASQAPHRSVSVNALREVPVRCPQKLQLHKSE